MSGLIVHELLFISRFPNGFKLLTVGNPVCLDCFAKEAVISMCLKALEILQ